MGASGTVKQAVIFGEFLEPGRKAPSRTANPAQRQYIDTRNLPP